MRKILSAAAFALAVTAAPMLAAPAAQAQDFNIEVGPNGIRPVPQNRYEPEPYQQGGYQQDRYAPRRMGCSPREARAAAREEGLRDAQVVRTTERSITVQGFTRAGPERMRFANERGCPTIG